MSVLEEFSHAIEQNLLDGGGNISTPLFNISLSIVGVFNDDQDSFDPTRHQVKIRITPGKRLKQIEKQIKTQKVMAEKPSLFC